MEEVNARQRSRNLSTLLVNVFSTAGYVGVVADQNERLGAGRYIAPGQVWIAVGGQGYEAGGVDNCEGELAGNRGVVGKTLTA